MRDSLAVSVGMRPVEGGSAPPSRDIAVGSPGQHTQAGQGVDTVNVHRTATADTLSATSPESQSGVHLVLDADQRIQHHRAGLVQVQRVSLHLRLLGGLIGVPAVDMEGLGPGLLGGGGILNIRSLRFGNGLAARVAACAHLGEGVNSRIGASKGGWAKQRLRGSEQARGRAKGRHSGRARGRSRSIGSERWESWRKMGYAQGGKVNETKERRRLRGERGERPGEEQPASGNDKRGPREARGSEVDRFWRCFVAFGSSR